MNFIDIILKNSQIKEAKLYGPSKKASESPETGIIIQNPSAFHVIKDSATLAHKYLPHFVFGHYANPFEVLKGKFTKANITEFVTQANSDIVMYQLLTLILEKIKKLPGYQVEIDTTPVIATASTSDPYGDYESYTTTTTQQPKQQDAVSMICSAFAVVA
jgi:hypothetical protein